MFRPEHSQNFFCAEVSNDRSFSPEGPGIVPNKDKKQNTSKYFRKK